MANWRICQITQISMEQTGMNFFKKDKIGYLHLTCYIGNGIMGRVGKLGRST